MKTSPARLELVNGTEKITIRPTPATGTDPVMCRSWDLGAPEIRYTTVPNPGADGITMSDGYLGSRTITLDLQILGDTAHDPYWYVTQLTRMAQPTATPYLIITRGADTYRMDLRASPYSLVYNQRSAAIIDLQLTFTCPLGMLESALKEYTTADPVDDDLARTDWIFPATFPKGFGLIGATYPAVTFAVAGDSAVTPIIYISGPATDPEIRCDGERFRFDGLTLTTGQVVAIDMGSGNIYIGKADSGTVTDDMSAYGAVDWGVSTYWTWPPGVHTLQYMSTRGTVTVQFRERRLTI